MVGAPAPYLATLASAAPDGLHILAQNVSARTWRAYGEFTADMLKSCGVAGAIVGHSERRARFGDTDDKVKAKVQALVDEGLQAVFCCGETLEEREAGRQEEVVHAQLKAAVLGCLWSFGLCGGGVRACLGDCTGKTATSAQARTCTRPFGGGWSSPLGRRKRKVWRSCMAGLASRAMRLSSLGRPTSTAA